MRISPWILGTGRAGQAMATALGSLRILEPTWEIGPVQWIPRGTKLTSLPKSTSNLLCIANPHGLHASTLLEAKEAGLHKVVCEKPACVNLDELHTLRAISFPVGIFHGYRQAWGPQTMRSMIQNGNIGEWIALEGRYWQSSTADKALKGELHASAGWKNDVALAGTYDVFLDLGTHWLDLASFLIGETPAEASGWRSYKNPLGPNRDSHLHLNLDFSGDRRAFASISKTVHGSTNDLEVCALGTLKSLRWNFLRPDEILIGEGRETRTLRREVTSFGSGLPPFHAMGWLEGYVEIFHQALGEMFFDRRGTFPRLSECLDQMEVLLRGRFDSRN